MTNKQKKEFYKKLKPNDKKKYDNLKDDKKQINMIIELFFM
jgi:hypothetical protein